MRSVSTLSDDQDGLGNVPKTTCCERNATCCNSCIGFCYLMLTCYFIRSSIADDL